MPNDNINRAIKKAAEAGEGDDYEEITYEGYGPAGVAIATVQQLISDTFLIKTAEISV